METSVKIPANIHALLKDMAEIRQTILLNAPQCLPALAPAIIDAENRINAIWQH
jgi:hypothetical protein